MKKFLYSLFLMGFVLSPYTLFASTQTINIGNVADGNRAVYGGTGIAELYAQQFTTDSGLYVSLVLTWQAKAEGSPTDNTFVYIYADSGDNPTGSALYSVSAFANTSLTSSCVVKTTTFPTITLSPFTKYWIVWGRDGTNDTSNDMRVCTDNSVTYQFTGYRSFSIWDNTNPHSMTGGILLDDGITGGGGSGTTTVLMQDAPSSTHFETMEAMMGVTGIGLALFTFLKFVHFLMS